MNKQGKRVFDHVLQQYKVRGGIEWTKWVEPDGGERQGYTINPVGGCFHDCKWTMPNGVIAECYAKTVAERLAQKAYPHGFEHAYIRPAELKKPASVKIPSKFFLDSMSDIFGHWLPDSAVLSVIKMAQDNPRHIFQALTKNPKRILFFKNYFPPNLHVGVSSAPDYLWGKELNDRQREAYTRAALEVLSEIPDRVTWFSFEPLSWDMADIIKDYTWAIDWAVIGAATEGRNKFQPKAGHIQNLLRVLDGWEVPVFFKGNLEWTPWRENFPTGAGAMAAPSFVPVPDDIQMPSESEANEFKKVYAKTAGKVV